MGINLIGILFVILTGLALIYFQRKLTSRSKHIESDSFTTEVLHILQDVYPSWTFSYDDSNDVVSPVAINNNKNLPFQQIFLGNLRNRSLEMGRADREVFIRNFLNQVTNSEQITTETLREKLLMRCRTPEEFSTRQLLMTPKDGIDAFEPIIIAKGEILFEPVLNLDETVSPISVKTMREQGFAFDDFINLASQNLLRFTPESAADQWEKLEGNIWISKLNDDFDTTRVFLFQEHLKFPFEQSPVVYAPSHTICLITPKTDNETLMRMVELGNASAETHRPLSRSLWYQAQTGWSRMTSDDRNSAIGRAQLIETLTAYDSQKSILEQHFEKNQQDIHVAAVIAQSDETDPTSPKIETRAVFIGADSYLPETDYVILGFDKMAEGQPIDQVTWDTLINILGTDKLKPHPDLIPVRYVFDGDLSKTQITALRAASTRL